MLNLTKLCSLIRLRNFSSTRPTVVLRTTPENTSTSTIPESDDIKPNPIPQSNRSSSGLVAAVFASLQNDNNTQINSITKLKPNFTDRKIAKATNANELLTIVEEFSITKSQAFKIVSMLAEWSASKEIDLYEYENDPRFVKLCHTMSRATKLKLLPRQRTVAKGEDLSMVLGVTGDDEAARLISSITLPQMIKVMSSLTQKKRRSTPLLRALAYNICRNATKLNLKQCSDLLYSMTVLNFPEIILLERIGNDALECLETNTDRSAVIGSILTSFGLLRYSDPGILDAFSDWVLKYYNICRSQDIAALFQTLAMVCYQPSNAESLYNALIPQLTITETTKNSTWLDIVWSLIVLNRATNEHISSVLSTEFITKLQSDPNVSVSSKIKLLNINAAVKLLLPNYNGPLLENNSSIELTTITRTKEKQLLVNSIIDSLGNLVSSTYLKRDINSGMGFMIDGEFTVDKKCNPVSQTKSQQNSNHIRVAILVFDYHDICRGSNQPHGANVLAKQLLEAQGYKVMTVSYVDFNPRDKLVQRVQYLEKQLKSIVNAA